MKVLNILHYPVFNGPANTCALISNELLKSNIETLNLIPINAPQIEKVFDEMQCNYFSSDIGRLSTAISFDKQKSSLGKFINSINNIREVIKEYDPDVVSVNGMENPHGAIAANLEGKPVVGQILGLGIPPYLRRLISGWTNITCDVGMLTGKSLRNFFPWFLSNDKCVYFYPPVDDVKFCYSEKNIGFMEKYGINPELITIGTVGNINPAKDYITFIEMAFLLLKKHSIPCQFIIKGNVQDTQLFLFNEIKKRCLDMGMRLNKDIFFISDNETSEKAISVMDFYVQTSIGEGISTALLEAMSMSKPVVATDVGATVDAIDDEVNGYLVDPKNPEIIANQIISMIDNPKLACSMGDLARKFVKDNANIQMCAENHKKAYKLAIELASS
ncbi:MAG: hypothetical protein CL733_01460 [Chloroflexi bacterium]|nr:hypothetical protein [Chloroflexota bacterium]